MRHNDIMARFHENSRHVDVLSKQYEELSELAQHYRRRGLSNLDDAEFDEYMCINDKIRDDGQLLDNLKKAVDEENYIMSAGGILFKYYDVVENGTTMPTDAMPPPGLPSRIGGKLVRGAGGSRRNTIDDDVVSSSNKSVLRFLQAINGGGNRAPNDRSAPSQGQGQEDGRPYGGPGARDDAGGTSSYPDSGADALDDDDKMVWEQDLTPEDRASLLEKYNACIEGANLKSIDSRRRKQMHHRMNGSAEDALGCCSHCGGANRAVLLQDGCVICNDCHTHEYILIDHDKPSYKDPPKEITYFAYKRINHFNEWLNQMQGKETTEIPDEVYDRILVELKKQRVTNMADLTNKQIRAILRKLQLHTYYEHSAHIKFRLNGVPMPYIPPEPEERLRAMFFQIQVPFLRHAPLARKNFLSYSYVLHKFMQLLDKDEYLDSFPLLKSRDKLHMQDQIWQKICADLRWEFYKSI